MLKPITHTYIKNKSGYRPESVNVRITYVNPGNTFTIEDAIGHVWFGVRNQDLTPVSEPSDPWWCAQHSRSNCRETGHVGIPSKAYTDSEPDTL